jgi:hypothetical protein
VSDLLTLIPTLLLTGPVSWFAEWPDSRVPKVGSAVYTVWDRSGHFIYAGMSGRSATQSVRAGGPYGRLNSHASGRRSGDQFCIYVADRLVLPRLHNRLCEIASGRLSLDSETRTFIRHELGFRVAAARDPQEALRWERALCRGETDAGLPLLNPHKAS